MKKTIMLLAATLAATAAMAQTNQVLSRNAVGYVRITAQANKLQIISSPFKVIGNPSATQNAGNVFGTNDIPDTTTLYIYDPVAQKYVGESFEDNGGPGLSDWAPGTNVIKNGQGFWLLSPTTTNFYLMGEVPDTFSNPTNSIAIRAGYQIISFPYPVDTDITNSSIMAIAQDSDALYDYNGTNYVGYAYQDNGPGDPSNGWYNGGGIKTNIALKVARGYWYFRAAAGVTNWSQPKPYTWP